MWFGDGLVDPAEFLLGSFFLSFFMLFLMSFRDDLLTMSTATDLAIAFFLGPPKGRRSIYGIRRTKCHGLHTSF